MTLFWFTALEMTFQSWAYTVACVFGPYKNREWTAEENSGVMSQEIKTRKRMGKEEAMVPKSHSKEWP